MDVESGEPGSEGVEPFALRGQAHFFPVDSMADVVPVSEVGVLKGLEEGQHFGFRRDRFKGGEVFQGQGNAGGFQIGEEDFEGSFEGIEPTRGESGSEGVPSGPMASVQPADEAGYER